MENQASSVGDGPGAAAPGPDQVLTPLRRGLGRRSDVAFAYLFGSIAKGRAHGRSDIDVAVWLTRPGPTSTPGTSVELAHRALELEGELEADLHRRVQVVVLNTAPLALVHNVLRHGRLICSRDDRVRVEAYVDHGRRYYDAEAGRRLFQRARARRIAEGSFGG